MRHWLKDQDMLWNCVNSYRPGEKPMGPKGSTSHRLGTADLNSMYIQNKKFTLWLSRWLLIDGMYVPSSFPAVCLYTSSSNAEMIQW
jgi:hypothetical protein